MSGRTALVVHAGAELFGSDRMALESVRGLRESGVRVIVALPSSGPLVNELKATGADVVILPMLVLRKALLKPSGWGRLIRDSLRGLGSAWRLMGRTRPDVVYVSTITIPMWPAVACLRRIPSVSHVHEAEASGSRLVNRLLYLPHLASRTVIVNSRFSLQTIRTALPALTRRSTVIYNGVTSPPDPAPPRSRLDGPLRVLFVGRLSPRKGTDLVISAAELLRERGVDAAVTVLGAPFAGYEWYEDQLRESARTSGVDVAFAGFHPQIWPSLADADVLVVPSRGDEPFGNTAVEGVLGLRPLVVTDSSGLREAAAGYRTALFVPADDSKAIADALESIAGQWEQFTSGVAESRVEALRRHAPETYRASVTNSVMGMPDATPPHDRRHL